MNPSDYVLYAIKLANDNNLNFGKTGIQKVMYFALPEDIRYKSYIPYNYGPYSVNVQRIMESLDNVGKVEYNYFENKFYVHNSNTFDHIENIRNDKLINRINEIYNFIIEKYPEKKYVQSELANISKIHIMISHLNQDFNSLRENEKIEVIKRKCKILGWMDLSRKSQQNIKRYLDLATEIDERLYD